MKCHRSLGQRSGVRFIVACTASSLENKGGRRRSLALDLPLKVLVWESEDGAVWLSYNSPEFLQERHGLDTCPFGVLANLVAAAAE
jgi:uncharacterized protein (DUF302 family)